MLEIILLAFFLPNADPIVLTGQVLVPLKVESVKPSIYASVVLQATLGSIIVGVARNLSDFDVPKSVGRSSESKIQRGGVGRQSPRVQVH